jgi:hypothetical protein
MKRREVPTAEVIDDSEELIMDYVHLVEALLALEKHPKEVPYSLSDLLDEEAGV